GQIAGGYLKIGKLDESFELMRGIRSEFHLVNAATQLADSFFKNHRRHDASAALDFVYFQVRKIVSEKSEDIPDSASTSDASRKSYGLSELGASYLAIGDLRGAEAAARAIDQPQSRALLLAKVAATYAKQGNKAMAKSNLETAFTLSSKSEYYNHDAH